MVRDPGVRKMNRLAIVRGILCFVISVLLFGSTVSSPARAAIAGADPAPRSIVADDRIISAQAWPGAVLPPEYVSARAAHVRVRLAQRVGGGRTGSGGSVGGSGGGSGAAGLIGMGIGLSLDAARKTKPPARTAPPASASRKKKVVKRSWVPPRSEARSDPSLPRFHAREVLALVAAGEPDATGDDLARLFRLTQVETLAVGLLDGQVLRYRYSDDRSLNEVITSLSGDPRVILAQRNNFYRLLGGKKKQKKRRRSGMSQYALEKIAIKRAHKIAKGKDVLVAVIDTGIDKSHPVLRAAVVRSFDATEKGKATPHTHGTAIAGVIAGQGAFRGVAPQARILAVRAFQRDRKTGKPVTSTAILLRAMDWAYGKKAKIFNLSFAGPADPLVERVLDVAHVNGVVHVAAGGNGGPKAPPAFPAAYTSVIAITALDHKDRLYKHANRGNYLAVAAPGVDIFVPALKKSYRYSSGTSIAAAHVTGLAALLMEKNPDAGAATIMEAIASTAHDLGPRGHDVRFGAGRVDAHAALTSLSGN